MRAIKIGSCTGFLAILILVAGGCKSGSRERRESGLMDEEITDISARIETIRNVYHLFPSPAEMLSVIDMADFTFDGDLLNPAGNVEMYLDTKAQTLNLGVYTTDLAYAALFGRHEETLDYLDAVRTLAEDLRVTGAIDEEMIENARNNVEYLDSLFEISNEAFVNMLFYCEKNDRFNTIILLSAGAFVESLYLSISMTGDFENSGLIIQHLAEQKYVIDNLMQFAESVQDQDANVASVIEDMKPIREIYGNLEITGGSTTVTKEGSNKLVIGGGSQPTMSREEFENLERATLELRTKIIGS